MTDPTIVRVDTAADQARAAADRFVRLAEDAIGRRGRFMVALAGGSTPRAMYRRLADPSGPGARVGWPDVHVFWGDERSVPPADPQSNYRMAREALLDHVAIPTDRIHRVPAELAPAEAAEAYERTLRKVFAIDEGDVPVFDLILLGMGEDGHTASIFPRSDVVGERVRLVAAPWVEPLGVFRITVTPPVLEAAVHVIVLVSGSGKAAALRDVLEGPFLPDRFPAQCLREAQGDVVWLADAAAAARLRPSSGA